MRCNFFQWIDDPDIFGRAFIKQKYVLNFAMGAETFKCWKPYVPHPTEKTPDEPRRAGWWWRSSNRKLSMTESSARLTRGMLPLVRLAAVLAFPVARAQSESKR